MDWEHFLLLTSYILPSGGLGGFLIYIARGWWKRREGKLTRADARAALGNNALMENPRLRDYIGVLRDDAEAHGYKPRPWPRGLRKE